MIKSIITPLLLLVLFGNAMGQCNLFTTSDEICAGESIGVYFGNTSSNFTYQVMTSNNGPIAGDSIVYTPAGTGEEYTVTFIPMRKGNIGGFAICGNPITVTVLASPDATLNFDSGTEGADNLIKNCDATIGDPDFILEVSNGSSTAATNTLYEINWGDGSAPYSSTTFEPQFHSYGLGSFELSFTVHGEGTNGCDPITTVYQVFNGTSPSVGLVDLLNVAGPEHACPPIYSEFQIIEIDSNVVGTTYDVIIDSDTVLSFQHPPPANFSWLFEETSCGHNATFPNTYEVRIEARNPCLAVPDFATLGPIIIGDTVKPDFTYNPNPICENEVITFTNTTIGAINGSSCGPIIDAAWSIEPATGWTLIDGDMESSYQIQVLFDDPGEYDVTIEAGNTCDTLEETKTLLVSAEPFADAIATLNSPNGCAPGVATFENLSTDDTTVTYNWSVSPSNGVNFINGTDNSSFEPEIEFSNQGNFNITLTVSNNCGNPSWDTTLSLNAQANFQLEEIGNICADSFVYDDDISFSNNTDSVVWNFTGGDITSFVGENPPPVVFAGSGDYTIEVNAYNACGVNTQTINFNVSEPVEVNAGEDFSVCFNENPVALSGSPANGTWSGQGIVGDSFDPSLVNGDKSLLVYVFDNGICYFSDTLEATIVSVPNLTAGPDETICINESPIALSGNTPFGGAWFGDAIASGGLFDPQLGIIGNNTVGYTYTESTLGCVDTVYKNVEIVDIPTINFNLPDSICVGNTLNLSISLSNGATVTWDLGNGETETGNPVEYTYPDTGNYTISAQVEMNGCVNTNQTQIVVIDAPVSSFSMDSPLQCNSNTVNFTNTSEGVIESIFWDFGNGITSTATNPSNILFDAGVYNDTSYIVTLTTSNICGSSEYIDTVFVLKEPVALFGTDFQIYCQDQPVNINNISYNSPTSFYWDFGNGTTSTEQHPASLVYPTSEDDTTYVITLIATNSCGSDTVQHDITIKSVDVVSFFNTSTQSGCAPLEVTFTSFSSVGASTIWDFGDGNTANEDTIVHVYQTPGMYQAMLAVDNGCSKDTSWIDIEVLAGPNVQFTLPNVICQHEEFSISNSTTGASGYSWDFGDGNTSIVNNPSHSFETSGTFDITLTAESAHYLACNTSLTKSIEVMPAPAANFDADVNSACSGAEIHFNNLSNADNYLWDFGDGNISYDESPSYVYQQARLFDVTLVVNNDNFCFDTIVRPGIVEVYPIPEADFSYSQSPEQIPYGEVSFENLSSEEATEFFWDFGDESMQSSDENPDHIYVQSGQHFVTLEVSTEFGCTDTIVKPIGVEFFGQLFVPNAMSPVLGDQTQASIFLPKGVGLVEYELEIYSTYGELLWRTTELSEGQPVEGWDGTFNGKPMPQDNYVWKIIAKFDNGLFWQGLEHSAGKYNTMGTFVLIR